MSYQVLARKWRPMRFSDMIGQDVTVRALQNALERKQLHHAYLFTGTRGVGKTTVARIFAKALNCEAGPVSEPCGTCGMCVSLTEGHCVDLVEVDAASHTKVEDTRELMEGVGYAPSTGRFRIYLIDEVHMLSGHSFNALLKTLEEPPEHVKFMLATTDPQKLPVTVLSRCLQFHLRHVDAEVIASYLNKMLDTENIENDMEALKLIAEAAAGSVRDAISMTDQAIAYGGGMIRTQEVREMLGAPERTRVLRLLSLLAEGSGELVLSHVRDVVATHVSPELVLKELLMLLHKVAVLQSVPENVSDESEEGQVLSVLAKDMRPEAVQLFYQAGVIAIRDFACAPTPNIALEIALLRMLGFMPFAPTDLAKHIDTSSAPAVSDKEATPASATPNKATAPAPATTVPATPTPTPTPAPVTPAATAPAATAPVTPATPATPASATPNKATAPAPASATPNKATAPAPATPASPVTTAPVTPAPTPAAPVATAPVAPTTPNKDVAPASSTPSVPSDSAPAPATTVPATPAPAPVTPAASSKATAPAPAPVNEDATTSATSVSAHEHAPTTNHAPAPSAEPTQAKAEAMPVPGESVVTQRNALLEVLREDPGVKLLCEHLPVRLVPEHITPKIKS